MVVEMLERSSLILIPTHMVVDTMTVEVTTAAVTMAEAVMVAVEMAVEETEEATDMAVVDSARFTDSEARYMKMLAKSAL